MEEQKPPQPTEKKSTKLKFFDLKAKQAFETEEYEVEMKNGRKFAVANTPSGSKAYRILGGKS